ncbi:hypothetical protein L484_012429 [Morus notabilis]|uniref:Uncharacterized protein n=1 Tax=Morus notabilis TaxID=981085 RepID=W9RQ86_9ROSA|nr:hypothetical protein L484_012429 [Morus notabilis]
MCPPSERPPPQATVITLPAQMHNSHSHITSRQSRDGTALLGQLRNDTPLPGSRNATTRSPLDLSVYSTTRTPRQSLRRARCALASLPFAPLPYRLNPILLPNTLPPPPPQPHPHSTSTNPRLNLTPSSLSGFL